MERERVQEAQELMQDKGIKARDVLQVARNKKRDDINKQDILELKTDGEPKETKIILPPSLPLPRVRTSTFQKYTELISSTESGSPQDASPAHQSSKEHPLSMSQKNKTKQQHQNRPVIQKSWK